MKNRDFPKIIDYYHEVGIKLAKQMIIGMNHLNKTNKQQYLEAYRCVPYDGFIYL